jgi:hypothetical protein
VSDAGRDILTPPPAGPRPPNGRPRTGSVEPVPHRTPNPESDDTP